MRTIPTTFESVEEYVSVFEPLLLEEFRAQLLKAKEDAGVYFVCREKSTNFTMQNINPSNW